MAADILQENFNRKEASVMTMRSVPSDEEKGAKRPFLVYLSKVVHFALSCFCS